MTDAPPKSAAPETTVKAEPGKEWKLPTAALSVDVSPDGKRLFAACLDGGIYEVNAASGESRQVLKHGNYASGVRALSNAGCLVSSGYDGTLRWHDLATDKTLRVIQAHQFWSWQLALSRDEALVASVTGQYQAASYKYEPAPEREPSVRVFDARTGELKHSFPHVPPVLSVAFSPDGQFLAAANMMGEIRIWELAGEKLISQWTTPDFTSWGIIKSHHYIGGIFGLTFTHDGTELLACGMGPMRDPMAGNGKQTWQRFAWREVPPRKTGEVVDTQRGNGLMETILYHPSGKAFVMAGKLAQGKWNAATFDAASGELLHSFDAKMRITSARFSADGRLLVLGGAVGQERKKDGKYPEFGRLKLYEFSV